MNQFNFIGRLTKDPELRYTTGQTAVCEFNIAITKDKNHSDFPRLKCFGKEAENFEKFKKKGDLVGITGHITTGSYEKDGKRIFTQDLIADRIEYLSSAKDPVPNTEYFQNGDDGNGNFDF